MNKEFTPEQMNRLLAIADIVDKGPSAILQKLYEFTDYIDSLSKKVDTNITDINDIRQSIIEIKSMCDSCMSSMDTSNSDLQSTINKLSLSIDSKFTDLNTKINNLPSYTSAISELQTKVMDQTDQLKIDELTKKVEDLTALIKITPQQNAQTGNGYNFFGSVRTRYVDDETLTGTINGSNTVFTIKKAPVSGSLKIYRGGTRQRVTEDYTFSGTTITFTVAPQVGEILLADYRI